MFDKILIEIGVDKDVAHDIALEIHEGVRKAGNHLVTEMLSTLNDEVFEYVEDILDIIDEAMYQRDMEEPDAITVSDAFNQEQTLQIVLYNEALQQMLDFCKERL